MHFQTTHLSGRANKQYRRFFPKSPEVQSQCFTNRHFPVLLLVISDAWLGLVRVGSGLDSADGRLHGEWQNTFVPSLQVS